MLEIKSDLSDAAEVAHLAAADLAKELGRLSLVQDRVDLVLTGGSVGIATLVELSKLLEPTQLSKIRFFWGDERFVSRDSAHRNELQARNALFENLAIAAQQLHPFPASEDGELLEAARSFAQELAALKPQFDIVLLGMGPDGHIASLFPADTAIAVSDQVVIEANSPKPPSQRISLSYQALNSASQVWFVVAGSDKAQAVAEVLSGSSKLPAARVSGRNLTRWYLDSSAASQLQ
jgi:6-phosphogluconolactonase